MIPLKDMNPTRRTPHVTWLLVAANVIVFTYEVLIGLLQNSPQFNQFIFSYGAVPVQIAGTLLRPGEWFFFPMGTLFTSMFIHGGIWHLAGNMLFLYVFGDNVEDELGPVRFLIFYLLCGLAGAGGHIVLNLGSRVPMVGASGAVSGIMGAYILLYPRARVLTLVFLFVFITVVEIPAYWFIAIWFGLQLINGLGALGGLKVGVAFWAHVGGFLAGVWLVRLWTRFFRKQRVWWE